MIALLLALIVVGVVIGIVPMDDRIRRIVIAIIAVAVVVWLLEGFGLFTTPSFGHGRWFR